MRGLKVGHYSNQENATGVSVFLFDKPTVGTYCLPGSSPASRELYTLELEANVSHIDGLVFFGGSAFGLSAVDGVMRWFKEHERGHPTPHAAVPIVPAAGIYDLGVKQVASPTADNAYQACQTARENNTEQGRVGAGTGASVGKFIPNTSHMSGGLGYAELVLADGLKVMAYAVVNSLGDVRDASGKIIAGARLADGRFANCEQYLLSGKAEKSVSRPNTTLIAVFTNAKFSKIELKRIAKMAIVGMARAISPVFSPYDGDILFCMSLGERAALEVVVGTMAAEVTRQAIVNAVKDAVIL